MKKIILTMFAIIFIFNVSYADEDCKRYNGLLQIKKYNQCMENKIIEVKQVKPPSKIMNATKEMLGKLNTDSKLTDWIKEKRKKKK